MDDDLSSKHPGYVPHQVLLVDDNLQLASTLAELLVDQGYAVLLAHDGEQALERVRDHGYEVGLIDLQMPRLNGVQLVERLIPAHPDARHLFMTGAASEEMRARAEQLSGCDVLSKPVDCARLLALLAERVR